MDELDIEALRSGWRGESDEALWHLRTIRRRRLFFLVVVVAEIVTATIAAVLGAWLIWLGMRTHGAAYSSLGAALFACGLSLAIVLADARRGSLAWRDETPSDLLYTGLRQVEASLRVVDIMRWYAAGILLFLVANRAITLVKGEVPSISAWLATSGGVTVCGAYWLWLSTRRRAKLTEQRAIARLLIEEQAA